MRAALRWTGLAKGVALAGAGVALAAAGACGGSVVVDGVSEDPGGAGASTASSTGSRGSTSTGDGSTGAGADPAAQLASCHAFCEHFDPGCPEHDCRQRCANLLAVPRPCNDLTQPYFDCLATDIFIGPNTSCEQAARWIGPLFDCLSSSAPACDTPFQFQCTSFFDDHRACQIARGEP
ncbi:hypothetical protein SOCE26_012540 [Sorangium cellulosum]|uniref:Secreted protein n=1 Tax=Sorangium cellulosum TaxID=56 RepID=A0A2L0EKP5_SORCE|nr:hypothetical protein [Sorangium cellulosum]AUX39859.1 hypothetical protein SOCE26_012540 [Sorangium cellulosum]